MSGSVKLNTSHYLFCTTRGPEHVEFRGVKITHDSAVCTARGIPCTSKVKSTNTKAVNAAVMDFTDEIAHYFAATCPGLPSIVTNNFEINWGVLGQIRYIDFNWL